MPKLIDADELIYFSFGEESKLEFVPKEIIEAADEVEAIPIEFIEKVRDNFASNAYRNAVTRLLEIWKEENDDNTK